MWSSFLAFSRVFHIFSPCVSLSQKFSKPEWFSWKSHCTEKNNGICGLGLLSMTHHLLIIWISFLETQGTIQFLLSGCFHSFLESFLCRFLMHINKWVYSSTILFDTVLMLILTSWKETGENEFFSFPLVMKKLLINN